MTLEQFCDNYIVVQQRDGSVKPLVLSDAQRKLARELESGQKKLVQLYSRRHGWYWDFL